MSEVSQIACTHCRNGWFKGTEVECVNGVLIDIDEAHEGWHRDVIYPPAPCISQSEDWPDGDRGCQERLDEWAAQGKTMTDNSQAAQVITADDLRAVRTRLIATIASGEANENACYAAIKNITVRISEMENSHGQ